MIRLQIKLMGLLKERMPENGELLLASEPKLGEVLKILEIRPETIQACSVNGSIERNPDRVLHDGDELTVLPPVGGG